MPEELTLLTWPDYLAPDNQAAFQRQTGNRIRLEIVPSAVEMVERTLAPAASAGVRQATSWPDVLCPPDHAVRELRQEGLLQPLGFDQLPNLANLDASFLLGRAHDPEGRYSVAKDWGTTGYLIRTDRVGGPAESWAGFWHLAREHSGRVCVLDAPGEVIGAALKMRGCSYNSADPEELEQARQDLLFLRSHLLSFDTDYKPHLASGEAWLALGWNGDAISLQRDGHPIRYVLPSEGSQIWEDDWAIAATTPRASAAHAFIDFMLRPEVAAIEAHHTGYATPNREALALLPDEVRSDPSIYPPPAVRARLEPGLPLSPEGHRLRSQVWDEIRAG